MNSLKGGQLILCREDGTQKLFESRGKVLQIGSLMSCDVPLDHVQAKSLHCEINCDAFGRVTIRNYSRKNPVRVNGIIINGTRPLHTGSEIKIFNTVFRWILIRDKPNLKEKIENEKLTTPIKNVLFKQASNSAPTGRETKQHYFKRMTMHRLFLGSKTDDEDNAENGNVTKTTTEYDGADILKTKSNTFMVENEEAAKDEDIIQNKSTNKLSCHELKDNEDEQSEDSLIANKSKCHLSRCELSSVLITSYSPATGKINKSKSNFCSINLNKSSPSIYGTPACDYSVISVNDCSTPKASREKNSMHLIDLVTPERKHVPRKEKSNTLLRSAIKNSVKSAMKTQSRSAMSFKEKNEKFYSPKRKLENVFANLSPMRTNTKNSTPKLHNTIGRYKSKRSISTCGNLSETDNFFESEIKTAHLEQEIIKSNHILNKPLESKNDTIKLGNNLKVKQIEFDSIATSTPFNKKNSYISSAVTKNEGETPSRRLSTRCQTKNKSLLLRSAGNSIAKQLRVKLNKSDQIINQSANAPLLQSLINDSKHKTKLDAKKQDIHISNFKIIPKQHSYLNKSTVLQSTPLKLLNIIRNDNNKENRTAEKCVVEECVTQTQRTPSILKTSKIEKDNSDACNVNLKSVSFADLKLSENIFEDIVESLALSGQNKSTSIKNSLDTSKVTITEKSVLCMEDSVTVNDSTYTLSSAEESYDGRAIKCLFSSRDDKMNLKKDTIENQKNNKEISRKCSSQFNEVANRKSINFDTYLENPKEPIRIDSHASKKSQKRNSDKCFVTLTNYKSNSLCINSNTEEIENISNTTKIRTPIDQNKNNSSTPKVITREMLSGIRELLLTPGTEANNTVIDEISSNTQNDNNISREHNENSLIEDRNIMNNVNIKEKHFHDKHSSMEYIQDTFDSLLNKPTLKHNYSRQKILTPVFPIPTKDNFNNTDSIQTDIEKWLEDVNSSDISDTEGEFEVRLSSTPAHCSRISNTANLGITDISGVKLIDDQNDSSSNSMHSSITVDKQNYSKHTSQINDPNTEVEYRIVETPKLENCLDIKAKFENSRNINKTGINEEIRSRSQSPAEYKRITRSCRTIYKPPISNLFDVEMARNAREMESGLENFNDCPALSSDRRKSTIVNGSERINTEDKNRRTMGNNPLSNSFDVEEEKQKKFIEDAFEDFEAKPIEKKTRARSQSREKSNRVDRKHRTMYQLPLSSSFDVEAVKNAREMELAFENFNDCPPLSSDRRKSTIVNGSEKLNIEDRNRRTMGKNPLSNSFDVEEEKQKKFIEDAFEDFEAKPIEKKTRARSQSREKSNRVDRKRRTMYQPPLSSSFDVEAVKNAREMELAFENFNDCPPLSSDRRKSTIVNGSEKLNIEDKNRRTMGKNPLSNSFDVEEEKQKKFIEDAFEDFEAKPIEKKTRARSQSRDKSNRVDRKRRTMYQPPLSSSFDVEAVKNAREMELAFENFNDCPPLSSDRRKSTIVNGSEKFNIEDKNRKTMGNNPLSNSFDVEEEKQKKFIEDAFENFEPETNKKNARARSQSPEKGNKVSRKRRTMYQPPLSSSFDVEAVKNAREMELAFENFNDCPLLSSDRRKSTIVNGSEKRNIENKNRRTMGNNPLSNSFDVEDEKQKKFIEDAFEDFEAKPIEKKTRARSQSPEKGNKVSRKRRTMYQPPLSSSFDVKAVKNAREMELAFENFNDCPPLSSNRRKSTVENGSEKLNIEDKNRRTMGNNPLSNGFDAEVEKRKKFIEDAFENYEPETNKKNARARSQSPEKGNKVSRKRRTMYQPPLSSSFDVKAVKNSREMELAFENFNDCPLLSSDRRKSTIVNGSEKRNIENKNRRTMGNNPLSNSFDVEDEKQKMFIEDAFEDFEAKPIEKKTRARSQSPEKGNKVSRKRRTMYQPPLSSSFDVKAVKNAREMELAFENFNDCPPLSSNRRKSTVENGSEKLNIEDKNRRTMGNNPLSNGFDAEVEKRKKFIEDAFENYEPETNKKNARARSQSPEKGNKVSRKRRTMYQPPLSSSFDVKAVKNSREMELAFENFNDCPLLSSDRRKSTIVNGSEKFNIEDKNRRTMGNNPLSNSFDVEEEKQKKFIEDAFEDFEAKPIEKKTRARSQNREKSNSDDRKRRTMYQPPLSSSFDVEAVKNAREMELAFENFNDCPSLSSDRRKSIIIDGSEKINIENKNRRTMGNNPLRNSFDLEAEKQRKIAESVFINAHELFEEQNRPHFKERSILSRDCVAVGPPESKDESAFISVAGSDNMENTLTNSTQSDNYLEKTTEQNNIKEKTLKKYRKKIMVEHSSENELAPRTRRATNKKSVETSYSEKLNFSCELNNSVRAKRTCRRHVAYDLQVNNKEKVIKNEITRDVKIENHVEEDVAIAQLDELSIIQKNIKTKPNKKAEIKDDETNSQPDNKKGKNTRSRIKYGNQTAKKESKQIDLIVQSAVNINDTIKATRNTKRTKTKNPEKVEFDRDEICDQANDNHIIKPNNMENTPINGKSNARTRSAKNKDAEMESKFVNVKIEDNEIINTEMITNKAKLNEKNITKNKNLIKVTKNIEDITEKIEGDNNQIEDPVNLGNLKKIAKSKSKKVNKNKSDKAIKLESDITEDKESYNTESLTINSQNEEIDIICLGVDNKRKRVRTNKALDIIPDNFENSPKSSKTKSENKRTAKIDIEINSKESLKNNTDQNDLTTNIIGDTQVITTKRNLRGRTKKISNDSLNAKPTNIRKEIEQLKNTEIVEAKYIDEVVQDSSKNGRVTVRLRKVDSVNLLPNFKNEISELPEGENCILRDIHEDGEADKLQKLKILKQFIEEDGKSTFKRNTRARITKQNRSNSEESSTENNSKTRKGKSTKKIIAGQIIKTTEDIGCSDVTDPTFAQKESNEVISANIGEISKNTTDLKPESKSGRPLRKRKEIENQVLVLPITKIEQIVPNESIQNNEKAADTIQEMSENFNQRLSEGSNKSMTNLPSPKPNVRKPLKEQNGSTAEQSYNFNNRKVRRGNTTKKTLKQQATEQEEAFSYSSFPESSDEQKENLAIISADTVELSKNSEDLEPELRSTRLRRNRKEIDYQVLVFPQKRSRKKNTK